MSLDVPPIIEALHAHPELMESLLGYLEQDDYNVHLSSLVAKILNGLMKADLARVLIQDDLEMINYI